MEAGGVSSEADNRQRELLVEEVAEAEVALADLSPYGSDELAAFNEQLRKLQNEATTLGLPTTKIDRLKLRVTSAIGSAPKRPAPGMRPLPKIRKTNLPAPPPPTAVPADSPAGDKIQRKLLQQEAQDKRKQAERDTTKAVEDLFK